MKYIFFIFFYSLFGYSQQIKFKVKDSLTNKGIEFVSVNFLNGYGVFSNAKGEVYLDLNGIENIELSHISYHNKTIKTNQIDSIIYLQQNFQSLKEIVVSKKSKKKYYKENFKIKKNDSYVQFGTYGYQIASLIQIDSSNNSYLDEVYIPIEIDEVWMKVNRLNSIENSIVRISFHENVMNYPSENAIIDSENILIDKKILNKKGISHKLKEGILIPEEGIYCLITFLGKADLDGNLVLEMPLYKQKYQGKEIDFIKYHPIVIPMNLNVKSDPTYSRCVFSKDLSFSRLIPTVAVPAKYQGEEKKEYMQSRFSPNDNYSINIGFKYYKYE